MFNSPLSTQDIGFGGHSGWRVAGPGAAPASLHRTIVFVDVENFASPDRTNADQNAVRAGLYHALAEAFTVVGVPWYECYHEDRGDGALILVPPEVPKSILATRLPGALAAALHEHNRTHHWRARIRLRVALHAGEVLPDEHGVAGVAINLTARLLEAKALKRALRRSSGLLAMIASEWFFDDVIRHQPAGVPDAYRRVRVAVKEMKATAWIRRPDVPFAQPAAPMTPHTDLLTGATPASVYVSRPFVDQPRVPHRGWQR